ncbi:MAG TPA: hypothetical protein VMD79_01225 [Solirubrobacteraceae bacterium]|nr:hypothetical protein [Solirubrobacteraceae bacterium]
MEAPVLSGLLFGSDRRAQVLAGRLWPASLRRPQAVQGGHERGGRGDGDLIVEDQELVEERLVEHAADGRRGLLVGQSGLIEEP